MIILVEMRMNVNSVLMLIIFLSLVIGNIDVVVVINIVISIVIWIGVLCELVLVNCCGIKLLCVMVNSMWYCLSINIIIIVVSLVSVLMEMMLLV